MTHIYLKNGWIQTSRRNRQYQSELSGSWITSRQIMYTQRNWRKINSGGQNFQTPFKVCHSSEHPNTHVFLSQIHMYSYHKYTCIPITNTHVFLSQIHMYSYHRYTCLYVYHKYTCLYVYHKYTCLYVYHKYTCLYIYHKYTCTSITNTYVSLSQLHMYFYHKYTCTYVYHKYTCTYFYHKYTCTYVYHKYTCKPITSVYGKAINTWEKTMITFFLSPPFQE
jgi:hypothetical protein